MPMSSLLNRVSTLPSYISSLLSTSSPQQHDASRTILHWVTQLEREAGVTSSSNLDSYNSTNTTEAVVVTGVAGPGPSTLNRRLEQSPIPRRPFPEFYMGSYEDALRTAQADAVTLCVVLVSDEHDDVAYFVKNTLTDPKFNQLLKDNRMIVWGGDVKHYEAHQASEKLSATTYPFVAFIALQPRSNASSTSQRPSPASASLTVLSRHEGPAFDTSTSTPTGPTSASTLSDHLSNHLLPRVSPFLERLRITADERAAEQLLRRQQDEAFALTAKLDREKMDAKLLQATQVEDRKVRYVTQMAWYRYARRVLVGEEPRPGVGASGSGGGGTIRIGVKLQDGRRFIRSFNQTDTLTSLYAFTASHLIPSSFDPSSDPLEPPPRLSLLGETPWSFQLALAYPRKEIPWDQIKTLGDVPELRGGQIVVEFTRGDIFDDGEGGGKGNTDGADGDDEYHTEEED